MQASDHTGKNIGFIGAGNMANSLIRGMLAHGHSPENIYASDLDQEKLEFLRSDCHIKTGSNIELAQICEVLVLAVKPQVMQSLCADLKANLQKSSPLIISIAAGITSNHLRKWLGQDTAIVRCMPNTPALVGKGASGLFATEAVSVEEKQIAQALLSTVGICLWVDDELAIDTVTAVSGSGPAYFFLFMEAMQNVAKELGLDEKTAKALTYQTALGAAELALASDDSTAQLRRNVTSPGGTTEQAILAFESGGLRELVASAVKAAQHRSIELADELD